MPWARAHGTGFGPDGLLRLPVSRQPSLDRLGLGSTGQRNNFIEYVCWTSEVKCLARALVQSKSDWILIRWGYKFPDPHTPSNRPESQAQPQEDNRVAYLGK